jgi:hypothetical protein
MTAIKNAVRYGDVVAEAEQVLGVITAIAANTTSVSGS